MDALDPTKRARPTLVSSVDGIGGGTVGLHGDIDWRSTTQRTQADGYAEDCNARIAGWMNECPSVQWAITAGDGLVLSRSMSRGEATEVHSWLATHLREENVNLQIVPLREYADYLGVKGSCDAQARFCAWAFKKLGHVTVFAFDGLDAPGFMLLVDNGRRISGKTLAAALYALLEQRFYAVHKPLYTDPWLSDSDA